MDHSFGMIDMNSDPRGLRTDGSRGDTKDCGIAQRYYQRFEGCRMWRTSPTQRSGSFGDDLTKRSMKVLSLPCHRWFPRGYQQFSEGWKFSETFFFYTHKIPTIWTDRIPRSSVHQNLPRTFWYNWYFLGNFSQRPSKSSDNSLSQKLFSELALFSCSVIIYSLKLSNRVSRVKLWNHRLKIDYHKLLSENKKKIIYVHTIILLNALVSGHAAWCCRWALELMLLNFTC